MNLGGGVLAALGSHAGGGGAGGGGVRYERLRDHLFSLRVHETPGSALELFPVALSAEVDSGQAFRKSQHLVIFRGNHELALAIDKPPFAVGKSPAAVFLKKVNLLKPRRDDHFPGFIDEAPPTLPLYGGHSLPKDSRILVFGFHQELSRPVDEAPFSAGFHRGRLIAEEKGILKARFDDEFALAVDKAPLAILFDGGKEVGEGQRILVLRFENKFPGGIHIAVTTPPCLLGSQIDP